MKTVVLMMMLALPTAALAVPAAPVAPASTAIPPVTPARDAAAGYAIGNAGFAEGLMQACSALGEPIKTEITAARAAWHERNAPSVIAAIAWIEYGIRQEQAAKGEAAANKMRDEIKAAIKHQVITALDEIFPTRQANAEACQQWAGSLKEPAADLAANPQHGPVLGELRAIRWPTAQP
jgi:hypothetical protein